MVEGEVAESMPEVVKGGRRGIGPQARLIGVGACHASLRAAPWLQIPELSFLRRGCFPLRRRATIFNKMAVCGQPFYPEAAPLGGDKAWYQKMWEERVGQ